MTAIGRNGPIDIADRHETVRRANVELVFRVISEHAPVSRTEVIRMTGLSKPTVLTVVAALADEGFIRDVPRSNGDLAPRGVGRVARAYEPNPTAAYVVGADLGGTKVAVVLADLAGTVVAEVEAATTRGGGAAVVAQIAALARSLAKQAAVAWSRIDAVCVGTPGVVNPDGTIRLADNVPGLDTVNVASALRRLLRTSVHVENDVNLAALGELEAGMATNHRTFALLSIGTGLGMGLVVDGNLVRGARGAAGEIAFLPLGADPASDAARRRGAFELAASGSGVQSLLGVELACTGRTTGSPLHRLSTARDVFDAAAAGDELATRVVHRHAATVADAILAVAALIDPELIVLGGGIGANPVLLAPVREAVQRITPWAVRIESSALGPRAGVIGAVQHARRSLPHLESARVSERMQAGERS